MVVNERQVIEGIGNEVFLFVVTFAVIAFTTIIIVYKRYTRQSDNRIHPSSESAINQTRQQLRQIFSDRFLRNNSSGDNNGVNNENTLNVINTNHYGMDNHCPVCLNEPRFPIETNCGHLFCAQCLIVYWRHGNWLSSPIKCPVCRQDVTVFLQCFAPTPTPATGDSASEDATERQRILHDINEYNRRYSGEPRPLFDYLSDLPTLLRHLMSEFFTVGGLMYMFRIRIVLCFVAAIMYLISPLDILPEAVFGLFGLLDDIFVVLLLAIYVTIIYRRFLSRRWRDELGEQ